MVREMVNLLLASRDTDRVGKNWHENYINRTPLIQTRSSRVVSMPEQGK